MATGLSVGPEWWLWWLQGYAEDHPGTGYMGRMRAIRVL